MKVSFVIPSYNERESLPVLLEKILILARAQSWDYEILIIDDGSTDGTYEFLKEAKVNNASLRVISFRKNMGKAAGLSTGFEHALGDVIVMMDADLQDDPNDVPQLINKLYEGFDAVTGWKVTRHDPWHKVIPSHIINAIVRGLFDLRLHDMNCGLKVFRKDALQDIRMYGDLYRYILIFIHANGFRVTELPTTHHPRIHGTSKYGVSRIFRGFFDLCTVFFLTRYSTRPLHFFGAIGSFSTIVGVLLLFYLSILRFMGETIGDRPLLLFGVVLFLAGLQLIMTGFIAELIIARQINTKPPIKKIF